MTETSFYIKLSNDDWNKNLSGWNCPALNIPSIEVVGIYINGKSIDKSTYTVDFKNRVIKYPSSAKPTSITVLLEINTPLTKKSDTDRWKLLSLVLPFVSAIVVAVIENPTPPKPPTPNNNCPEFIPKIICSETFETVYKKWPNILSPLEHYLASPSVLIKSRDSELLLEKIDGDTAIFILEDRILYTNPFEVTQKESIKWAGDPDQEILDLELTYDNGTRVKKKASTAITDEKSIEYFINFKLSPNQTATLVRTTRIKKALKGEYALLSNSPILEQFTMDFKISDSISHKVQLMPWENAFELTLNKPYINGDLKQSKRTISGPIFSGHGFIPVWEIEKTPPSKKL